VQSTRHTRVWSRGPRERPAPVATTPHSPPYAAYAGIMGAFAGLLAAAAAAQHALGRDPRDQSLLDLAVLGAATFKAARTISRDEVTSFLREPFVEGAAHEGDEEALPSGDLRQAIGELVTCSRCIGTWAAAGLTMTQVLAPRFGRLLTWSLAAAGVNDVLQSGFTALTQQANILERRASQET
jgi:uncharacterized protein DUF1360